MSKSDKPEPDSLDQKLDYILKSHACTQVFYDEHSVADYPIMFEKIKALIEVERAKVVQELINNGWQPPKEPVDQAKVDELFQKLSKNRP